MNPTTDMSTLTVRDFSIQIANSVNSILKNFPENRVHDVIKEEVQRYIVSALTLLKKDPKEIEKSIFKIMRSTGAKDLIKKIYDMVIEKKSKEAPSDKPVVEQANPFAIDSETRIELEESLLPDDEKEPSADTLTFDKPKTDKKE
jgi:lysyl-tRNA synthetase class II